MWIIECDILTKRITAKKNKEKWKSSWEVVVTDRKELDCVFSWSVFCLYNRHVYFFFISDTHTHTHTQRSSVSGLVPLKRPLASCCQNGESYSQYRRPSACLLLGYYSQTYALIEPSSPPHTPTLTHTLAHIQTSTYALACTSVD